MTSWSNLEKNVREYSQYIWNMPENPERINGVNFDCVLKISEIEHVIIEVTENKSLDKIRSDIAKIQAVRMSMMVKNIMIRPYIICGFIPTQGMRDAGNECFINVMSFMDFQRMFFDFSAYNTVRSSKQFGSAIDPLTGKDDTSAYTPVGYLHQKKGEIDAVEIAERILKGEKIILLGDYGSGKSRCFKEVFKILSQKSNETLLYPIAIDLKEVWGLVSAVEIIRRHFINLGMSENQTSSVIKAYNGERLCFLLDGFDEIGSRPWSENKSTLIELRKHALQGVKDLLSKTGAGCLISGRDHYFNSEAEMFSALGMDAKNSTIAKCKNEFSVEEFDKYLQLNHIAVELPEWLPKKPLVLKTIASLKVDKVSELFESSKNNEIGFWFDFIDAMCKRDSLIHPILDEQTVKNVLIRLASLTRNKPQNYGPLTEVEVVNVFHEVTGTYPNEQSTVMLQRLPGLGRVSSETSDRNFIDTFILDGLRALDLSEKIQSGDQRLSDLKWINPLYSLGTSVLVKEIEEKNLKTAFVNYIKNALHRDKVNRVSISDAISAISSEGDQELNMNNLMFDEPHFGFIDFDNSKISNVNFRNGIFEYVKLGKIDPPGVIMQSCHIVSLYGVSSATGLPDWIENCTIENYESVDTLTSIKNSGLNKTQEILVSILIKVYKQDGNGRLEHTLTKGLAHVNKKNMNQVLRYLISNGFLETSKDKGEMIYKPVRKFQGRIEKIITELNRSEDSIWKYVTSLE
ncbi:hypothetical protein I5M74_18275 [Serratia marcescens]|nr:hypothetical protein [Serratia marcescens]